MESHPHLKAFTLFGRSTTWVLPMMWERIWASLLCKLWGTKGGALWATQGDLSETQKGPVWLWREGEEKRTGPRTVEKPARIRG